MNNDFDSQILGNMGVYLDEHNVISFQMGTNAGFALDETPGFIPHPLQMSARQFWLNLNGYNIATRGVNNRLVEEMEIDIKKNRLLPKLYSKQKTMLYGLGPHLYTKAYIDNKIVKQWIENKQVNAWLNAWQDNGMEMSYTDFAQSIIKNYYWYQDFFCKIRLSYGNAIGQMPIAGIESLENRDCRLATNKTDVVTSLTMYKDLRQVAVGNWLWGGAQFQIYPRFDIREINNYNFAAISHHKEKSIADYYGSNETHQGARDFIRGSNQTAQYINSFLKNSLAAKLHVIIPNAWVGSKRSMITKLCEENKKLQKAGKDIKQYSNIDIGTEFKESTLIQYINAELRKLSEYLSGADNQGKAYASFSFNTGQAGSTTEERWRIENVDLKYKEYIESLITYDKRADEVITMSVGLDSSISSISKDGIISKSGADVYYNYMLYMLSLTPDDEKCSEPFNLALKVNFPALYAAGYRFGYYREMPDRQQDISPNNRLNAQQS